MVFIVVRRKNGTIAACIIRLLTTSKHTHTHSLSLVIIVHETAAATLSVPAHTRKYKRIIYYYIQCEPIRNTSSCYATTLFLRRRSAYTPNTYLRTLVYLSLSLSFASERAFVEFTGNTINFCRTAAARTSYTYIILLSL